MVSSLEEIVHSLKIRSLNQEDNAEYQGWLKNLLVEKGKRKADEGKSSFSLLKKVQLRIN